MCTVLCFIKRHHYFFAVPATTAIVRLKRPRKVHISFVLLHYKKQKTKNRNGIVKNRNGKIKFGEVFRPLVLSRVKMILIIHDAIAFQEYRHARLVT